MHGFFGSSSAGSFVTQIREAMAQRLGDAQTVSSPSHRHRFKVSGGLQSKLGQWRRISLDECALPPKNRADALISVYWNAVHPLYPFIDRAVITSQYESLFSSQTSCDVDSSFLCALNIIFALSCQLGITTCAEKRHHSASVFFQRAQKSLDLWQLQPSIESVQVLLLLGQYLQSTNEPFQCWTFVGSAIRMAENLGLHLNEASENVTSTKEREIMRRVWHACVLMDRWPLTKRISQMTQVLRSKILRTLHGWISSYHSLQLYDILDEILATSYSSSAKCENTAKEHSMFRLQNSSGVSIMDIDSKLMAWEVKLPEQLQNVPICRQKDKSHTLPTATVFVRQAIVMRQRFLYIRLLSLRPVLCSLIASNDDDAHPTHLVPRLARQCSIVCIKVAQETINLVYTYRDSIFATTGLLTAWWYNALFVYSAATVLLAAQLRPSLQSELSRTDILKSWSRALSILDGYKEYSESIPKLIATLHMLLEQIPEGSTHPKQHDTANNQDVDPGEPDGLQPLGAGAEDDAPGNTNARLTCEYGGLLSMNTRDLDSSSDPVAANTVDWEFYLDPTNFSWPEFRSY
ncbi:hypothetical protein AJ80_00433 [Polytolypa hystricis UAMH7299]|uniref:Xylanolytic transcriptional activator regulatory domain-containing protein n=1 Tax=Polytolypa hystricis (strain UAMH7299) TaxID=1447883 RepID=A0A2B7Z3S1_POLH7|nr:hypothetical protein AJ80_00433 [Polytolypa hystricis UAMH7299]